MRLQLALNVADIDEAVAYYTKLFGAPPHKRRPGYANFAVEAPPLKLVLFENAAATERLHHLGVEVMNGNTLTQIEARLDQEHVLDEVSRSDTCCHATQDKLWSQEPQGLRWEWYRITDDEPGDKPDSLNVTCCAETATASACGCA